MAITLTERKAADLGQAGAGATKFTFAPVTTITPGTVAILAVTMNLNTILSSVADKGNTWAVDATYSDGTRTLAFASCQVVAAISSVDSITGNYGPAANTNPVVWVQECTGLAAASIFDKIKSASATGTALSTGGSATLSQSAELCFGAFRSSSAGTWTKGASWTDPTTPQPVAGSSLEYQIVAATTSITANGSTSTSGSWAGLAATYKAAAAAADSGGNTLTLLGVGPT